MRLLLIALVAALALLYVTLGLRFGYVTLTPTWLVNAQGQNRYTLEVYEEGQRVGYRGRCEVQSGRAVLRLLAPDGRQIVGRTCQKMNDRGDWALHLVGGGQPGRYQLVVDFDAYTGLLDLSETRE